MTQRNLLALGCVHGDELIGKYLFDRYPQLKTEHYDCNFILANYQAMLLNQRCIEADLNRVFPGKKDGNLEERRAAEIQVKVDQADLVLDFHQTTSQMGDVIITQYLTYDKLDLIQYFRGERVILDDISGTIPELRFGKLKASHPNAFCLEYSRSGDYHEECLRAELDFLNVTHKYRAYSYKKFYQNIRPVTRSEAREYDIDLDNWELLEDVHKQRLGLEEGEYCFYFIGEKAYSGMYGTLLKWIPQQELKICSEP